MMHYLIGKMHFHVTFMQLFNVTITRTVFILLQGNIFHLLIY